MILKHLLVPTFLLSSLFAGTGCGEGSWDPAVEGPRIFAVQCSRCHGADGRGADRGPDLVWGISEISQEEVVDVVLEGTPDMDPIELTLAEAEAVADYLVNVLRAPVQ